MRGLRILFLSVFIFLGCKKDINPKINIAIEKESLAETYRYDNFNIYYSIDRIPDTSYVLFANISDGTKNVEYFAKAAYGSGLQGLNNGMIDIRKLNWVTSDYANSLKFDDIEYRKYNIYFTITSYVNPELFASNTLLLEINKKNPDTTVFDNFSFTDINHVNYNLVDILEEKEYLVLFGFATWCGWAKKSIPYIKYVDSLYSEKIQVVAVEGSSNYNEEIFNNFIETNNFNYPIVLRVDNTVFNDVLHPDKILSFPRFAIINSERKRTFIYNGYNENITDTIIKYLE